MRHTPRFRHVRYLLSSVNPPRWRRAAWVASVAVGVGIVGLVLTSATSCQPRPMDHTRFAAPPPTLRDRPPEIDLTLPRATAIRSEPTIRVRIVSAADQVRIHSDSPVRITPARPDGQAGRNTHEFAPPLTIDRRGERFRITDARGRTVGWALGAMQVRSATDQPLQLGDNRYPERLVFVALRDEFGQPVDRFDIVNHLGLETYLPGVLERELFPNWDADAFAAQAIAARSYALFERAVNTDKHYDLQATTASQVYGGEASNPTALAAARQTRGQILTYAQRLVPAFYSSTCGGTSQDATAAFPQWGQSVNMQPLTGHNRCNTCEPATHYRWGPITRPVGALSQRIAAWGLANHHTVANMSTLRSVEVTERGTAGRPAVFMLTDDRGRRFEMIAEHFRFACNFDAGDQPDVASDAQLRSSHMDVSVTASEVRFANGRGFGHGVGLCQWGAQGMAEQGRSGTDIARHYYPAAQVQRLY